MHYYKKNIGDYSKKAGRLTILQHGVYNLLIDSIYDREIFPTEAEAIDWVWAATDDEISAVRFVLKKFFIEKNGVFIQKRILEEIEAYQEKSVTNKRIATEREAKRREKMTNRERTVNESSPNQEPLTNNQEPIKKKKEKEIFELPDWVNKTAWNEFEKHRRDIRKPLTELAKTKAANCLNGFSPEEQQAAVDQTIQNRWTGIFPKKLNGANYETNQNRQNTGNNGSGSRPGREEVDFNSMDW